VRACATTAGGAGQARLLTTTKGRRACQTWYMAEKVGASRTPGPLKPCAPRQRARAAAKPGEVGGQAVAISRATRGS
jgi:hypothetical protein